LPWSRAGDTGGDRCRPQARHFVTLRYLALRRSFGSAGPPRKIMVSQISLFRALQLMIDKITRRAGRRFACRW
jgi:hypothetical protein